jgi:RNA polymerase sigma-70 factor (ECF subfamily)
MTSRAAGEALSSSLTCMQRQVAPACSVPDLPEPLLSSSHRRMSNVFDESYLRALKERNPEVENHLFSYFSRPVRIKLRALLRSREVIQDAGQETFLRVLLYFRAGKTLDNPGSLPAFIHATCHNVALEFLRAHTRHDQLPEKSSEMVATGFDPERQMVTGERKALVHRVLNELSGKDRQLLKRVFLDEEDKDAVCQDFGVDRSYLRVLLHRARHHFKEAVSREGAKKAGAS